MLSIFSVWMPWTGMHILSSSVEALQFGLWSILPPKVFKSSIMSFGQIWSSSVSLQCPEHIFNGVGVSVIQRVRNIISEILKVRFLCQEFLSLSSLLLIKAMKPTPLSTTLYSSIPCCEEQGGRVLWHKSSFRYSLHLGSMEDPVSLSKTPDINNSADAWPCSPHWESWRSMKTFPL